MVKRVFFILFLGALFSSLIIACKGEDKSKLIDFIHKIDGLNQEQKFKNVTTFDRSDTLFAYLDRVRPHFKILYQNIEKNDKLEGYLDSILGNDIDLKVDYLLISYHVWKKEKKIDNHVVRSIYYDMVKFRWDKKKKSFFQIMRHNDSSILIGDTVILHFSPQRWKADTFWFDNELGLWHDTYGTENLLDLKIIGIIQEKRFDKPYKGTTDPGTIIYKLRILDASSENLFISNKLVKNGDTIDFNLTWYGRIIEKYQLSKELCSSP